LTIFPSYFGDVIDIRLLRVCEKLQQQWTVQHRWKSGNLIMPTGIERSAMYDAGNDLARAENRELFLLRISLWI
jgi:hypothetical protein